MRYRRLGGTDLDVSVICLGPMRAAAREPGDDAAGAVAGGLLVIPSDVNMAHVDVAFAPDGRTFAMVAQEPARFEIDHSVYDHSVRVCRTDNGRESWRRTSRGSIVFWRFARGLV